MHIDTIWTQRNQELPAQEWDRSRPGEYRVRRELPNQSLLARRPGCSRTWGNLHCPCIHADQQFPDCEPGETQRLLGWLSFYEGTEIEVELQRIERLDWQP